MKQPSKDTLLAQAQAHVDHVRDQIHTAQTSLEAEITHLHNIILGAEKGGHDEQDTDFEKIRIQDQANRLKELQRIADSPYFNKCILQFAHENTPRTIYFGKFPFAQEQIVSWTTPLARLRFVECGEFDLEGAVKNRITGTLSHKDQYLIVNGAITFMATEGIHHPRELVHQERLMRKKTDFSLPEIVAQMEKAQDDVIRAHWHGSFLIAGPAGSGKTTLALHRVAYLTQAPETEKHFPSDKIIVFVQDQSTKHYFSALLPDLGIKRVTITTFDEWIIKLLSLKDVHYVEHILDTEKESDLYENAKHIALEGLQPVLIKQKHWIDILKAAYAPYFNKEQQMILHQQFVERTLDRFDLTLLGTYHLAQQKEFKQSVTKYELLKGLKHRKVQKQERVEYSLIIVDEAENYLAPQIALMRACISNRTRAMLYVGDLAQQTKTHTIKDWHMVGESFPEHRKVVLHKVYRNTKQILTYIQKQGYTTTIPAGIREGQDVIEIYCETRDHELRELQQRLQAPHEGLIGILAKSSSYLEPFRTAFENHPNLKCLTINEAQGVEFDQVFLVGVRTEIFNFQHPNPQRAQVDRDLFYVALTRATNELYLLGSNFSR